MAPFVIQPESCKSICRVNSVEATNAGPNLVWDPARSAITYEGYAYDNDKGQWQPTLRRSRCIDATDASAETLQGIKTAAAEFAPMTSRSVTGWPTTSRLRELSKAMRKNHEERETFRQAANAETRGWVSNDFLKEALANVSGASDCWVSGVVFPPPYRCLGGVTAAAMWDEGWHPVDLTCTVEGKEVTIDFWPALFYTPDASDPLSESPDTGTCTRGVVALARTPRGWAAVEDKIYRRMDQLLATSEKFRKYATIEAGPDDQLGVSGEMTEPIEDAWDTILSELAST